jgi:hypothetical protein
MDSRRLIYYPLWKQDAQKRVFCEQLSGLSGLDKIQSDSVTMNPLTSFLHLHFHRKPNNIKKLFYGRRCGGKEASEERGGHKFVSA